MLKHLVGAQGADTIAALKEQLGVTTLDVMLIDTMEEYFALLGEAWILVGEEARHLEPPQEQVQ